jgi:hypothetical protein
VTALAGLSTSRPTAACDDQGMSGTVGMKITQQRSFLYFLIDICKKKRTERKKEEISCQQIQCFMFKITSG